MVSGLVSGRDKRKRPDFGGMEYSEISECVPGPGVNLGLGGMKSLYRGCHCVGQCGRSCSCSCAYDDEGCLSDIYFETESPPITECNSRCTCTCNCRNRVSQNNPNRQLSLFETAHKGFGVISSIDLLKGSFVGEYVGEVISSSLTVERLKSLSSVDKCYIMQYNEHMSNGTIMTTNIDATLKGNMMRFINHSCEPNLIVVPVRSDSVVPRLCLFTSRNVAAGEELCFSYFGQMNLKHAPIGKKKCYCGSQNCVGYLPLEIIK